jgi:pSer/pThr/pTyr-binding forkhead associated (FHA) protein
MPQLILWSKEKKKAVGRFTFDKPAVEIGRGPQNDVRIDNLTVSLRHARIEKVGDEYIIEDLGSTNGTYVNGTRISRARLNHMDRIRMGRHVLFFLITKEPAKTEGP